MTQNWRFESFIEIRSYKSYFCIL